MLPAPVKSGTITCISSSSVQPAALVTITVTVDVEVIAVVENILLTPSCSVAPLILNS